MSNIIRYSPHITIYKPQYSSISSILNRGAVVLILLYLILFYVMLEDFSLFFFIAFNSILSKIEIHFILILFVYHCANAIKKVLFFDSLIYTHLAHLQDVIFLLILFLIFISLEINIALSL